MPCPVSRRCTQFGAARIRHTNSRRTYPVRIIRGVERYPRRDRLCFRRGALHARRHVAGDGALLLDGGGGRRDVLADALDRLLDAVERADDVAGDAAQAVDLLPDPVRRRLAWLARFLTS